MVSVSSCSDVSNHPLIDALEVYARPHRAGTAGPPSPPRCTSGVGVSRVGVVDDGNPPASALVVNTMEALEACSRLLGHTLTLAGTAGTPASTEQEQAAVAAGAKTTIDALCRDLADSALSVLRKTCLAADKARWRALRASSRSLLSAAQPDATRRLDAVTGAYAGEILLALVGKEGADGSEVASDGGVGEGRSSSASSSSMLAMSPVRLTRVAQLCGYVCTRRSTLLLDELAPALAKSGGGGGDTGGEGGLNSDTSSNSNSSSRPCRFSRFVFPALLRRFWESCVWRTDGGDSMQMVLRCVLNLAVHEMRAAGTAAAAAAAATAASISSVDNGSANAREFSEQQVLRAGLAQLMPLLRSSVARVSQASSEYVGTLLLGALPEAADLAPSSSPSASSRAVTGRREAESGGGGGGGGEARVFARERGDANPESRASAGGILGAYAASVASASEMEAEAEATSDPGTDSDTEADRKGSGAVTSVQLALAGLRRAGHLSIPGGEGVGVRSSLSSASASAGGGGGGGDNPPPLQEEPAADSGSSAAAAFEGLVPGSVKRARTSSPSSSGGSRAVPRRDVASRGDVVVAGRADMDVVGGAVDHNASSSSSVVAELAAAVAARGLARGSPGAPGASSTPRGASAAAAASSKICYRCDGCDDFPLQHVRYHCKVCPDFDLCPQCYEVFHGPSSQFQGGNAVMLRDHSTSHEMVALQVQVCLEAVVRGVSVCFVSLVSR